MLWESDRAEGGRGNEKREKRKRWGWKPSTGTKQLGYNSVTGMGPTNSVKNVEWWKMNDGAKRVFDFKWGVMSDGNWVMTDERWKKIKSKQALSIFLFDI